MYLQLLYSKKEDLMRQYIGEKVKLSPLSDFLNLVQIKLLPQMKLDGKHFLKFSVVK